MCQSLLLLSELLHPVMSKKVDYHSIDQQINVNENLGVE
jgi:hypothetical protein